MDDRVQQCPNCGAAVLANALYCVTCGIRLPEPPGRTAPAEGTAASPWRAPAEDVWIGEAPALDHEEDLEEAQSDFAEPAPDTGAAAGEAEADAGDVIAIPPSEAGRDETGSGAMETGASPAHDGAGEIVGPEGELSPPLPESDTDDERTGQANAEPARDLAIASAGAGSDDEHSFAGSAAEALEADDFEPAGWDDSDDNLNDAAEPETADELGERDLMTDPSADAQTPMVSSGDRAAALERAAALLDELRQLLPGLAAPVASEPGPDLSGLRDQAIATRGERSFDDFASLREAIHDAVHRPRDIEVVLRLSQHAEDINALLKERDRLQTALDDLLRGLEQ